MVIQTTIQRDDLTPTRGDKDEKTIKNSIYSQSITVYEKGVPNYTSALKEEIGQLYRLM